MNRSGNKERMKEAKHIKLKTEKSKSKKEAQQEIF